MSAFIADPEHINALIWAGRSAVSRSAGRAPRELATWRRPKVRSPSPFEPSAGSPSIHRGDPVTVNLHCGGLARLRSRLAGARLPLRRAAPTAFSPYARAPWALARRRARAKIRFQLFRLVPVDGATPRWTAAPR